MERQKKVSLRVYLILAFFITSIIPTVLINLFSYYNTSGIVRDNMQELSHINLEQTRSSLDVWLESYEDILFQIYTDDDIVDLIEKINQGEDVSVCKNQLRRTLHGLFYTKEYIKSISVLTENGTLVFYDLLTGSSTENSWLDRMDISRDELYDTVSADNVTHVLSTQEANEFGGAAHYLFHLGHRIIDYRKVEKRLGIVVVSIDERMLAAVCNSEGDANNSYNFIVDGAGKMVSHPNQELLTTQVIEGGVDKENRKALYEDFVKKGKHHGGVHMVVDFVHDDVFGWDLVNVSSQEEVVMRLERQQQITMTVMSVALVTLVLIIIVLIRRLTGSLQNLAGVMKQAGKGELSARVEIRKSMPAEVETIATEFNCMLERLAGSIEKEREAQARQKDAEITALEAQMNPHFLYNTLDTINWMAIDRDEYEISNSINALANILRYGIDNSNGIVTVRQEYEWLRKYLFLQQTRLKNTFQCELHVEPEVMDCQIHKLLLQPFVENAILHGFEGVKRTHFLSVNISGAEKKLKIIIYDNGRGIPEELVEEMNHGNFPKSSEKNHIGMENAITRIGMYYGGAGRVTIESRQDEYTRILIEIPLKKQDMAEEEDR